MFFLMLLGLALYRADAVTDTCHIPEDVKSFVVGMHNMLREYVATRGLKKSIFGDLPGTKSLFQLRYDTTNEALAAATTADECSRAPLRIDLLDRAVNFYSHRLPKLEENQIIEYYKYAIQEWIGSVKKPFDANATWTDNAAEAFANMIYYKTLTFGCAHKYCETEEKVSISCVYGARPKLGKPLYINTSKNRKGCTSNSTCKKVVSKSKCETSVVWDKDITNDGNSSIANSWSLKMGPLCITSATSVDEPTNATTTATTTSTTTIEMETVVNSTDQIIYITPRFYF